jgi:hypothetical protein
MKKSDKKELSFYDYITNVVIPTALKGIKNNVLGNYFL